MNILKLKRFEINTLIFLAGQIGHPVTLVGVQIVSCKKKSLIPNSMSLPRMAT